jgi:hypothetical protein
MEMHQKQVTAAIVRVTDGLFTVRVFHPVTPPNHKVRLTFGPDVTPESRAIAIANGRTGGRGGPCPTQHTATIGIRPPLCESKRQPVRHGDRTGFDGAVFLPGVSFGKTNPGQDSPSCRKDRP